METDNQNLQLREHSTGLIAILTTGESAQEYERRLTIEKIISDAVPISVLKKVVEPRQIALALDIQLTRLVAALNLKWSLNDSQIKTVVGDLLDKYPNETLEDFMLCFKKARTGEYGELIRLDGPIIFSWMAAYLDEKYKVIEDNLLKQKDEYYKTIKPENSERDWLGEWQKSISENGVREVAKLSESEIRKEGQERPVKQTYPSTTVNEIRKRELHLQWIRENYDARTGDPLPNWKKESDWLTSRTV